MTKTIGFIGLGVMGQGMVRNLLKAGFSVKGYNRTKEKGLPLEQDGASHRRYDSGSRLGCRCRHLDRRLSAGRRTDLLGGRRDFSLRSTGDNRHRHDDIESGARHPDCRTGCSKRPFCA